MTTKLPGIPAIPPGLDPQTKAYLKALTEVVQVRSGRLGDPLDRAVTLRELINSGLAEGLKNNPFDPNQPTVLDFAAPIPASDFAVPPAPTSLTASAAFQTVLLEWSNGNIQFSNFAFTEIFRHTSDVIGDAVLVAVVAGNRFADQVDSNSTHYYWVRHVSEADVRGPFNAANGVVATTADINAADIADQAVTNAKLAIDAVQGAVIAASAITTTKIQDNAISTAKIAANAVTANEIAANAVTANEIAANSVTASELVAGTITASSGILANASVVNATIANAAVDNAKIANLDAGKINTGQLSANRINVDGATITANGAGQLQIPSLGVGSAQINNGAITTAKIGTGQITNALIGALAVNTGNIADLNVTRLKIENGAVSNVIVDAYTGASITFSTNTLIDTTNRVTFTLTPNDTFHFISHFGIGLDGNGRTHSLRVNQSYAINTSDPFASSGVTFQDVRPADGQSSANPKFTIGVTSIAPSSATRTVTFGVRVTCRIGGGGAAGTQPGRSAAHTLTIFGFTK